MDLYKKLGKRVEKFLTESLLATGILHIKSDLSRAPKIAIAIFGLFICFPLMNDRLIDYSKPVWYLKINRRAEYTLKCIQNWINVAGLMGANIIFVCDSSRLEFEILRKCRFDNVKFTFIKSEKKKNVAKHLYTGGWGNATYAHLTPIYHAAKHNVFSFWNIDADDTMLLLYPENTVEVIRKVENISENDNIDAISLDMHRSKTYGVNWTLGVLYIRDPRKIIKLVENNKDKTWGKMFEDVANQLNFDWFLTYIKNKDLLNIQTFYVNDCMFIHWGEFLINPTAAWINYWHDNFIYFPLLFNIFNMEAGKKPIADCICIDIGDQLDNGRKFWENEVNNNIKFTKEQRNLQKLFTEFNDSKNLINV